MDKIHILTILYVDIIKYLEYIDYLNFNKILNQKDIQKYNRKCLYCNSIPYFPSTINYSINNGFINNKSEIIKCKKSLMYPICLFCLINEWINKFNKKSRYLRKKSGFKCPYECCQIITTNNSNDYLLSLNNIGTSHLKNINYNKYKLYSKNNINIINNEIYWKNIYNNNVNCKFCKKLFIKYDSLFRHYKYNLCSKIKNKFYHNDNIVSDNYDSDNYDSEYDCDCEL